MKAIALLLALPTGLVLAAGGSGEDAQKDLKKLQGTWKRISAEVNGKKPPADALEKERLTVKGDKYTLQMADSVRKGTFKLDPTKSPKQLDIVSGAGPNKGKILKAIYKLEGGKFTYCVALPGNPRPTKFTGAEGSGQGLYVNERVKP